MKTILKLTGVFALVAVVNVVFASGNITLNMIPLKNEKAAVAISTLSNSNFNVTISDDAGQIFYFQENADQVDVYQKVYNFENLEDGTYNLTVLADGVSTERQFQKQHGRILVGDEKTTLEPFFGFEGGLLRCSYLNFNNDKVTLRFNGDNGELVSKQFGKEFSIQQAFDLSKLEKGSYEAVLDAGTKQFTYNIEVE
jgi:hypothetical protein